VLESQPPPRTEGGRVVVDHSVKVVEAENPFGDESDGEDGGSGGGMATVVPRAPNPFDDSPKVPTAVVSGGAPPAVAEKVDNPFGDDEEEEDTVETRSRDDSTNPFGDDDEKEDSAVEVITAPPATSESENPFGDDDQGEEGGNPFGGDAPRAEQDKPIPPKPDNPFGDDDDATENPFGDEEEKGAEQPEAETPFGDDDDSEKPDNPFGDDGGAGDHEQPDNPFGDDDAPTPDDSTPTVTAPTILSIPEPSPSATSGPDYNLEEVTAMLVQSRLALAEMMSEKGELEAELMGLRKQLGDAVEAAVKSAGKGKSKKRK